MTRVINVVDYPMGTGKTEWMFKKMNSELGKRYIYITPLLSEAEDRATSSLAQLDMRVPEVNTDSLTKSDNVLELLQTGKNISTTHMLFRRFTQKHLDAIRSYDYTIVIDEVAAFIEPFQKYNAVDLRDMVDRGDLVVHPDLKGQVSMEWKPTDGNTYTGLKYMCDSGILYAATAKGEVFNIQFPTTVIDAAKEVFVLTYMYESSLMNAFMKMHKYESQRLVVPELEERTVVIKQHIRENLELVHILGIDRYINSDNGFAFSHGWWDKQVKGNKFTKVFKVLSNWLNNNKDSKDRFFFTCPQSIVDKNRLSNSLLERQKISYFCDVVPDEFPKWLAMNTKATNLYSSRNTCFYLMNVYPHPSLQMYLSEQGNPLDPNKYALSEMIQFIWRGSIRNKGQKMKLFVASPRMRALLEEWVK